MIVGQSGHVERRIDFVCLSPHACGSGLVFFEHACFFTVECGPLDLASWKCRAATARCAARRARVGPVEVFSTLLRSFNLVFQVSARSGGAAACGLERAGWGRGAGGR